MTHGLRRAAVAGMVGSLAMIPFGLALRATGHRVNVYGELLVQALLGRPSPIAMFVQHLLIGAVAAVPLWLALARTDGRHRAIGVAYGAAMWLVVNSLALPLAFRRPTPWELGWSAIWPSLLVHLVYGLVTAVALDRAPASRSKTSAHRAPEPEVPR